MIVVGSDGIHPFTLLIHHSSFIHHIDPQKVIRSRDVSRDPNTKQSIQKRKSIRFYIEIYPKMKYDAWKSSYIASLAR